MIPTGDEPLFGGKKRQKSVQTGTGRIKHGGVKVNHATKRLTDATAAGAHVCVCSSHMLKCSLSRHHTAYNLIFYYYLYSVLSRSGCTTSEQRLFSQNCFKQQHS